MGAWGPKLYQDDVAEDVKDIYIAKLKRGKTNEEATKELIKEFNDIYIDDVPIFWFALADSQWRLGKLLPEVKERAIEWIDKETDQARWMKENPNEGKIRAKVLEELKTKLNTLQPPEKKFSKHTPTKCEWSVGDVYAYELKDDYAKEKDFLGKYIIMIKVGETIAYGEHIVPEVYVIKNIFIKLPKLEDINKYEYIKQFYNPTYYFNNPNPNIKYRLHFDTCSKRVMPIKQLIYIGNIGAELRIIDNKKESDSFFAHLQGWKNFEKYIIDLQLEWMKYEGRD